MLTRFRPHDRATGDGGAIGVYLAIVVAFALYAVTQLTITEVSANQINHRVDYITSQTSPIAAKTSHLTILDDTDRMTGEILAAAKPLSGQAQQIIDAAKSIDSKVSAIKGSTDPINSTVRTISGTVTSINGVAKSINSVVGSIHSTFVALDPVVTQIQSGPAAGSVFGVANINRRADVIIGLAHGIKSDLDNTIAQVKSINQHTVGICKSLPVALGAATGGNCS